MILAEALNERADIQTRLSMLKERLSHSARVQEGENPPEDPYKLLEELDNLLKRLEWLIFHINLTNSSVKDNGETLTELLARRDAEARGIQILASFLDSARNLVDRYSRSEVRICSTVSVAEMQKKLDEKQKSLRMLDMRIQRINWTVDLI